MRKPAHFRTSLLEWYARHKRDLPWRRNQDPYRVWLSEIMLQQTRVAAVIPYSERFIERFGSVEALASASEQDLLAAWAGLGYYSRARNLQAAAKLVHERGRFPNEYERIQELPGIGDYTAAAISSIAFGLPRAALDGNVIRVLSRVLAEAGDIGSARTRFQLKAAASELIDPKRPGEFNQAMMELGATVCLPKQPQCLLCPVAEYCEARRSGRQREFPVKRKRGGSNVVAKQLLILRTQCGILFWRRPSTSRRLGGFWELPDPAQLPDARVEKTIGHFRHTIVDTIYCFQVLEGTTQTTPDGFSYLTKELLDEVPLSTTAKKALACLENKTLMPDATTDLKR